LDLPVGEYEKPDHPAGKLVSGLGALVGDLGIGGGGAS
jgi:hypothetical protein